MDISPPHASVVLGMSNCLGTVGGIVSPFITAAITKNQTLAEWRIVFYIVVGIYMFALIIFDIFAQGEVQSWSVKEGEGDAATPDQQKAK